MVGVRPDRGLRRINNLLKDNDLQIAMARYAERVGALGTPTAKAGDLTAADRVRSLQTTDAPRR